jgi:hypothetical protein
LFSAGRQDNQASRCHDKGAQEPHTPMMSRDQDNSSPAVLPKLRIIVAPAFSREIEAIKKFIASFFFYLACQITPWRAPCRGLYANQSKSAGDEQGAPFPLLNIATYIPVNPPATSVAR